MQRRRVESAECMSILPFRYDGTVPSDRGPNTFGRSSPYLQPPENALEQSSMTDEGRTWLSGRIAYDPILNHTWQIQPCLKTGPHFTLPMIDNSPHAGGGGLALDGPPHHGGKPLQAHRDFHFINYTAADVRTKCYHNNWLCAQGSVPDQRWHHNAQQPNSYDMPSCVIMVQCK